MVDRIVLGVDGAKGYVPALNLLVGLGLRASRIDAVHVVEIGYGLPGLPSTHSIWTAIQASEDRGRKVLENVKAEAREAGLNIETALLQGRVAGKIIEFADAVGAGLIAVGSERKGRWGSLFFGSVTRELSINARASILVGKGNGVDGQVNHAIFAMDHSPYAHECAKQLLNWKPTNLKRVTFVTGYSTDVSALDMAMHDIGVSSDEIADAIGKLVAEKSEVLCKLYREAGIEADHVIEQGDPRDVIADAMEHTKSELLILGARGHSLTERITLGSVSMHFVVNTPYSTLVLRR
jgi:nucleotide-binding universal stress UspA family protein